MLYFDRMTTPRSPHPLRIAVIVGSTRPGRRARLVADWAHEIALEHLRNRAEVEIVDLADLALPLLDEPVPAAVGDYTHDHTQRWADIVATFDGFVFITPEYNHSSTPALINAIDFLFAEWNDKVAGFITYGINGGDRAAEHLRLILAEVKTACVRSQVSLKLFSDFTIPDISDPGTFSPADHHQHSATRMFDEIIEWGEALRSVRERRRS